MATSPFTTQKNWKQYIVSQGEPFQIEFLDRKFGKRSKVVFKVSDADGTVTVNGAKMTGSQNITGNFVASGDMQSATAHVSGASTLHATTVTTLTATGAVDMSASSLVKLPAASFHSFCTQGNNGTGHVTATGAKIGDKVIMAANVTDHVSAAASFEATVTVNDQIQQSSASDLSAKTIVFLVLAES
jgi:hypothetical protein